MILKWHNIYNLAILYEKGEETEKDLEKASKSS